MRNRSHYSFDFIQKVAHEVARVAKRYPRRTAVAVFVLLFAGIGLVMLGLSGAATYTVALEAESGTPSGNYAAGTPTGASGNAAIKFGAGAPTPSPNPAPTPSPTPPSGAPAYPIKVSANKRYFVDQNNVPYLLTGETSWELPTTITLAEATQYLDARKAQGFNTILMSLSYNASTDVLNAKNRNGDTLFLNRNIGTPNPAYFDHLDRLLALGRERGMQFAIWPIWMQLASKGAGSNYNAENMAAYGTFLANRYKNTDNIIWIMGGDWGHHQDIQEGRCPHTDKVRAMANAIKTIDNRHLISHHPGLNQSSTVCYNNDSWIDFNGSYWDFDFSNLSSLYRLIWEDYNKTPTRPGIMLETAYEGLGGERGNSVSPREARTETAHQLMAGGAGSTNGYNATFMMLSGWQQTITTRSGYYAGYTAAVFKNRAWWKLIPEAQNPTTLTNAGGSSYGQQDHALASRADDGSLVIAYAPTGRTLTINMTRLSGQTTARWYDPTNGQYKPISGSPFANSGSQQFTTPGNNSAGDSDWFLVLETNPVQ